MRKNYFTSIARSLSKMGLAVAITTVGTLGLQAQGNKAGKPELNGAEAYMGYQGPVAEPMASPDALFDIQLDVNATAPTSSVGMAGAQFVKNASIPAGEFWTTKWQSDTILRWDATGAFIEKFSIPGISAIRSLAFDGTYLYAGNNTTTISEIDPVTKTLTGNTINVGAAGNVRHCSYDASLDNNNGGFWVGNFGTDISAVDMTGTTLMSIPAATHGLTAMYGSAFDPYTPGGPYLWLFDQSGANTTQLERVTLATGLTSAVVSHDVFGDFSATNGLTSGLAGGLFITNNFMANTSTIGGMIQGTPDNVLFGYELINVTVATIDAATGSYVYPNPTADKFYVAFRDNLSADVTITVTNAVGQELRKMAVNPSFQPKTEIDLTGEANGVYFVKVQNGEKSYTQKMVLTH